MSRELGLLESEAALRICAVRRNTKAAEHYVYRNLTREGACEACRAQVAALIDGQLFEKVEGLPSPGVGEREKDSERLDWLDNELHRFNPVAALTVKYKLDRTSGVWVNVSVSARTAIDAAMQADARSPSAETPGEGER